MLSVRYCILHSSMVRVWLCFVLVSVYLGATAALTVGKQELHATGPPVSPTNGSVQTEDGRVLVVVLGHGQAERAPGLTRTLQVFYEQLTPERFDCMVFVWNDKIKKPVVPRGCDVHISPGVFMEYTRQIPETKLLAAKYVYLMADDVTLDVPGRAPMNIASLLDLATANCLDVLTPAQYGANYEELQPNSATLPGRFVKFIDFQGSLLTPDAVRVLQRLSASNITGCWGYDSLMWSGLAQWTGRIPRIAIADDLVVNTGTAGVGAPHAEDFSEENLKRHPCGRIVVNMDGMIYHAAGADQIEYWRTCANLTSNHMALQTLALLLNTSQAFSSATCNQLQSRGTSSLQSQGSC